MRILTVEDREELASLIAQSLSAAGLLTDTLHSLSDARQALASIAYSAVVLDASLPGKNGLTLLRELRGRRNFVPVIILSTRSGVSDRVTALREGADDYLTIPFAMEELIARIQSLLRRMRPPADRTLSVGDVSFNIVTRQFAVGTTVCPLSSRESVVLEVLLQKFGRVVQRDHLQAQLFGVSGGSTNAVEVYIHRLRKTLSDANAGLVIHTIRHVGYLLAELPASPRP
jgi:two-component system response regulator TctD